MANVCACGCGEYLPEGSTRQYKRGHKANAENATADSFTEVTDEITEDGFFTIADAAQNTPDDPEPKDQEEYKPPKPAIKITAAVRRDVEGMLAFAFGMSGQMWSMVDPLCGSKMLDMGPVLAKKYTPIICQSPSAVRFITKGGKFALYLDAAVATWPLVQLVFAHHIAKTIRADLVTPNGASAPAPNEYVVQ